MVEFMEANLRLFWNIALSILSAILTIVSVSVSIATLGKTAR